MSIFKFEFAHTIKQIWVIGEVMPEETSALGQLYDTLGVFGVVQGANEVMLRTLEREMGDTDQHIRQWLQGDDGKYQPVKIDGTWHTYFIDTAEDLYDYLTGNYNPACIVDADEDPFNENSPVQLHLILLREPIRAQEKCNAAVCSDNARQWMA